MKNIFKKSREAGFVETIIIVIVALLLMKYFGVTFSTVMTWIADFVKWFTSFFKDILK